MFVALGFTHKGSFGLRRFSEKGQKEEERTPNTFLPQEEKGKEEGSRRISKYYIKRTYQIL